MNKSSILFTITISFIISLALVITGFIFLLSHQNKKDNLHLFERYIPVIKKVVRSHEHSDFDLKFAKTLEYLNFTLLDDESMIDILNNKDTKVVLTRKIPHKRIFTKLLRLEDYNYIYIQKRDKFLLIRDNIEVHNHFAILIPSFIVTILIIILLFIFTIRKLLPLKTLKDKVKNLGDEDFEFDEIKLTGKDEVSQLALEFKNSAKKLKNIKDARNIFIRNIMHELKTPITKGKFLTEIQRSDDNDAKLKEVFIRLELLINELASVEELISSSNNIKKDEYFLDDIIDNANDILMVDESSVDNQSKNMKLNVNFKLFSIALKNLIDNAIKYSDNKKVIIKNKNEDLVFENSGKMLEYPLEKYFEPFFSSSEKSKDSFGLGLYIVKNILEANNYKLDYEYEDGINRFICKKD